jgi:hypothetical protein
VELIIAFIVAGGVIWTLSKTASTKQNKKSKDLNDL